METHDFQILEAASSCPYVVSSLEVNIFLIMPCMLDKLELTGLLTESWVVIGSILRCVCILFSRGTFYVHCTNVVLR